ncbi:MAG: hypothetical protein ACJ75B_15745 [Flavisolibacter sp.]
MRIFILLLLLGFSKITSAQTSPETKQFFHLAIGNAHTARPFSDFSSLFYRDFHPLLEAGWDEVLKNGKNHQFMVQLSLGYLFHRWVQQNLSLSLNGAYYHRIINNWSLGIKPGIGYQLSIPHGRVYKITDNGLEDKGHILRSQFIANLGFQLDRKLNDKGTSIFMEYNQRIQTPFVREYVPLLPYNQILVGLNLPVH